MKTRKWQLPTNKSETNGSSEAVALPSPYSACSGDLAAHVGLNQPKVGGVGLALAAVPSQVGGIGMCNFKQNDSTTYLGASSQLVSSACHNSGVFGGCRILFTIHGANDRLEIAERSSESAGFLHLGFLREEHDPDIEDRTRNQVCHFHTLQFGFGNVAAKLSKQLDVGRWRIADIYNLKIDTQIDLVILKSEWPSDFGLNRNPSPVGCDQSIFGNRSGPSRGLSRLHRRGERRVFFAGLGLSTGP